MVFIIERSIEKIKKREFEEKIRKIFPKTNIIPYEIISLENIKFGKYSFGSPKIIRYNFKGEGLEIGNYVSIAKEVTILLGGEHNLDTITTFPLKNAILKKMKK